jgi:hypothetical protein
VKPFWCGQFDECIENVKVGASVQKTTYTMKRNMLTEIRPFFMPLKLRNPSNHSKVTISKSIFCIPDLAASSYS